MTILNVDDRPENRYLFETILRSAGHEVVCANDGAEALGMLRQCRYDLIVSDVVMPGMDGFQFCREVKADPATRDIPFVFFTAVYTEPKDEEFALSLGAVRFLVKPLEPDQLVAEIQRAAAVPAPAPAPLAANPAAFLEEYNRRVVQKLEAKLAENERLTQRLRESEARLNAIIEGTSDAISVKDRQGRYLHINAAGARLFGRPVGEILGHTDREVLGEAVAAAHAAAEQRLLTFGAVESCEEPLPMPGDPRTRFVHSVRGPMRDAAGAIIGTFSISRDITERRLAEQSIRKLTRALEQSPVTIVITNAEGVIEYVNPRFVELTGYTAGEAIGQNPRVLKSGHQPAAFYRDLWQTIRSGHDWRGVFENRRKNGEIFTEQAVISPVKDESGAVTHFIAIKEDITERLRLEEQLRHSQKMDAIGRLAGGVAHDFNNLLTIIQLEVANLGDQAGLDPDGREAVQQIAGAAQRATTLTRQLLAFSRKQQKDEQTVHLGELVEGMGKLMRRILGEDVQLATAIVPEPVAVRADPGMLEQALLNLAVNARDAMPQGGHLKLAVDVTMIDEAYVVQHPGASAGYRAHIAVSDTGCGIPPEHLGRIFEPFFTTKAAGKGTGLGLATVYGVVKQHHGWLTVESTVGVGTTFHLFLPALMQSELGDDDLPEAPPLPRGAETVLLAEDDEQIRHLMQVALERQGYQVLVAEDGASALALAARHSGPLHLLVTDLIMPGGLNGAELAQRLQETAPALRTIFITGYPPDVVTRQLHLDKHACLVRKPFSVRSLLDTVRQRLDKPPN